MQILYKENNETKYLTLFLTDESKYILKKYKELPDKIKGLIRSISSSSNRYDENYMKITFKSDDNLLLIKP